MINTNTMANFMPQSNVNMFEMGRMSGPAAGANTAIRQALAEWKAQQAGAQEQQNKMDLVTHEYNQKKALYGAGGTDPDAAGPFTQVDPKTGKAFVRSTTIDTNGIPKVSWAPVSPMAPENLKQEFMNKEVWGPLLNDGQQPNPIQQGAGVQAAEVPQVASPKALDRDTAAQILKQAGGDKNKARQIAASQGYKF